MGTRRNDAELVAAEARLSALLSILDSAFDARSWHGPNLRGVVRGVTAERALRRPLAGRHNIHEQVLHAAYWTYAARRVLAGGKRGSFELSATERGTNWFRRDPPADARRWRNDLAVLEREHAALRSAVAALDPRRLDERLGRGSVNVAQLISGIAAHHIYHAGQIALLKRATAT
ncbi:MAG: DinB family protein [Phycisphaerales bacterium]